MPQFDFLGIWSRKAKLSLYYFCQLFSLSNSILTFAVETIKNIIAMKKQIIFLSFLFCALAGIAQSGNTQMNIEKGAGIIDGQNISYAGLTCTSPETSWSAKYVNIADSENVRIFYHKTTDNDCVITFPDSTVIPQPNGREGVNISGLHATITSTSKGTFIIIIVREGAAYKVSVTRIID
jgi:hypothetical protein